MIYADEYLSIRKNGPVDWYTTRPIQQRNWLEKEKEDSNITEAHGEVYYKELQLRGLGAQCRS